MPIVKIDNLNVYYQEEGLGPTLVLVHGNGTNLNIFDNLIEYLKKDFKVLRYDQRGYGLTDKPLDPSYSTELWADDLYKFLRKLNFKKVILIGHSMGGRVCATFAIKHPEKIKGLIILNTTWFGSNPKGADVLEKSASLVEKEGMTAALKLSRSFKSILKKNSMIAEKIRAQLLQNNPLSYAQATRAIAKDYRDVSKVDILQAIKCPTLILIGDSDSVPLKGALKMYEEIKHSKFGIIPGSGHYCVFEKPEISIPMIINFLKVLETG